MSNEKCLITFKNGQIEGDFEQRVYFNTSDGFRCELKIFKNDIFKRKSIYTPTVSEIKKEEMKAYIIKKIG